MGQVKSTVPITQESIEDVMDDVAQKIAQKEKDLESEKGSEARNQESIITLKVAMDHLQAAKKQLEKYKSI